MLVKCLKYIPDCVFQGVNWEPWKGHLQSLDFAEIKIRPVGAAGRQKRSLKRRVAVY